MKLADCPKGPVLINGQLYIYCDMASPDEKSPHAHMIRCDDWQYVTFQNYAHDDMGRTPARNIEVEPVKIEVVR